MSSYQIIASFRPPHSPPTQYCQICSSVTGGNRVQRLRYLSVPQIIPLGVAWRCSQWETVRKPPSRALGGFTLTLAIITWRQDSQLAALALKVDLTLFLLSHNDGDHPVSEH